METIFRGSISIVACAAFRVQKTKQLLEHSGVGRIPQKGPVAPDQAIGLNSDHSRADSEIGGSR
jgi:hypothetical protein